MTKSTLSMALCALFSSTAFAGDPELSGPLQAIQDRWAEANYRLRDDARLAAFEALNQDVEALVASNPNDAQALVWQGIVQSTYAGAQGGLSALSLAKQAKASLEQAMALDPDVLDGSAWTSLGTLYAQVPGWPIGFGNDKKAREFLSKGLELNPEGIDSNYFYAIYLADDGEWEEAAQYLERAQSAPSRPGRESADAGRQMVISTKLAEVKRHTSD